jgi:hypothetical protein
MRDCCARADTGNLKFIGLRVGLPASAGRAGPVRAGPAGGTCCGPDRTSGRRAGFSRLGLAVRAGPARDRAAPGPGPAPGVSASGGDGCGASRLRVAGLRPRCSHPSLGVVVWLLLALLCARAASGGRACGSVLQAVLSLGNARATAIGSTEAYVESQRRNDNISRNAVDGHKRSQLQRVDCCSYARTSPHMELPVPPVRTHGSPSARIRPGHARRHSPRPIRVRAR